MALVSNHGLCATALLASLLIASTAAHADLQCSGTRGGFRFESDSWGSTDKLEHFAVSAPFGAFGGWLALEVLNGTCPTGGFSYKDLFADALGALAGAWLSHWAVTYSRDSHSKTFGLQYNNTF
ncbi:hypothetical protein [Paraburkholderia tagetis]|uniref:Lipoprotein n=1 Tax=Paraburkholderia tagetis TaxID=2913261 RepID=A0A9X1RPQ1_9BURK|nr:hypothetical protein [Paraburkholderia tagetis]MCG5073656.1 hypothetical protein [Paraburkholderia tagetis]